jgi:hypothetical protein
VILVIGFVSMLPYYVGNAIARHFGASINGSVAVGSIIFVVYCGCLWLKYRRALS